MYQKNIACALTAQSAIFTQEFATPNLLIEMPQSEILAPTIQLFYVDHYYYYISTRHKDSL